MTTQVAQARRLSQQLKARYRYTSSPPCLPWAEKTRVSLQGWREGGQSWARGQPLGGLSCLVAAANGCGGRASASENVSCGHPRDSCSSDVVLLRRGESDAGLHFLVRDVRVQLDKALLVRLEVVVGAVVRLYVAVLRAEHVAALARHLHDAHLLRAMPALILVLL